MLGVTFIAGTLVLADTITRTFNDLFADVYRGTDAIVRAEAAFKDPNGFADQRGRVDASLIDVVWGVGPPTADDEIVIDKKSADDTGYQVGDTVPVLAKGEPATTRLAGIVKFGTADSPGCASSVIFTTPPPSASCPSRGSSTASRSSPTVASRRCSYATA